MIGWGKGLAVAACWALALGGCASWRRPLPPPDAVRPMVVIEEAPEWRGIASEEDSGRINRLDGAWAQGLETARRRGYARALGEEGALLDPGAALGRAEPPPGPYHCRIVRLGGGRGPAFRDFPPFFCHVQVDDDRVNLSKQTGSHRLGGWLYPDDDADRMIFLGALIAEREEVPPAYGEGGERDMAGVVERVGPFRYRMVVPWPRHGGAVDVYELVPAVE